MNEVVLQESIYQSFHNVNNQVGGAIYVNNPLFNIRFSMIGFADCTTVNECGAFYLNGYQIQLTNVCGFMCEAIGFDYQLFKVDCNDLHDLNVFTSTTIVSCGMNNQGNSAFGVCGQTRYNIVNINSSYNFNYVGDKSFGTCFRTFNIKGYHLSYYDFSHSTGLDIINTHFYDLPTTEFNGTFEFGNIYNCTSTFIFKYRGVNYIQHSFFGLLSYSSMSFKCGASNSVNHLLRITNCHFDRMPTDITAPCEIGYSHEENPFKTEPIYHFGIDICPVPTKVFTESQQFTESHIFTASNTFPPSQMFSSSELFSYSSKFTLSDKFSHSSDFTRSNPFSPSSKFTKSNPFLPSSEFSKSKSFSPSFMFTRSILFSPSSEFSESLSFLPSEIFTLSNSFSPSFDKKRSTLTFTQSSIFTPSFTFSPNATKYPDGLGNFQKAEVSGRSFLDSPANVATIGATAGISIVVIVVSVILMVLYLRSKQRQLIGNSIDLSDSFLCDSTDSQSSSYSYSYYTYEYTYESYEEESEISHSNSDDDNYYSSYYNYSDLDGTFESLSEN